MVTTSLLAIVTVPVGLRVVSVYVPVDSSVTSWHVALTILRFFLVPLGIGMIIRAFSPKLAARISEPLLEWGSVALGVCAVSLLVASWRVFLTVGLETLLAFAAFTLVALVAAYLVASAIASIPYVRWRSKVHDREAVAA